MSERRIGRVISVDSFRLIVQLDDDLKGLYKSGFNDIYEIARINSYLIIPVGADRIVSIVTRVKIQDETDIEKSAGFITLPKAQRYLVATMIGTIAGGETYLQGVYNFPILDNPVWYVTRADLDKIFDTKDDTIINYENDYYLPIGTSPAFSDYQIKINPDKFFGKHVAILGNTGSGKSCTVASIIQSLFKFEYNDKCRLKSANFIIFDTNGEYKKAFLGDGKEMIYEDHTLINPIHVNKDALKIPYWFMNYDDIDFLFQPSANTQAPILKRAISLAKNETTTFNNNVVPQYYLNRLIEIQQLCLNPGSNFRLKEIIYHDVKNIIQELTKCNSQFDFSIIIRELDNLWNNNGTLITYKEPYYNGYLKDSVVYSVGNFLTEELLKLTTSISKKKALQDKNIDLPIWFEFEKLCTLFIDEAIKEQESSNNKIREYISTLRLRLQSYFNDERIANPLLLSYKVKPNNILANFLAFILGDICKVYNAGNSDIYSEYFLEKQKEDKLENRKSQIVILDMSLIPFDVLETITGLIGRMVLEFLSRFDENFRGNYPTAIILEEAQNYIPEKNKEERTSIAKKVFERIAREGRKFGLSLVVSSQRPSELSKTVLAQCNTFVIHRLQNPEDQKYVRQLVSAANEDILQQLPILPQQHAIIMGDGVRTPVQIKINKANPKPNSDNPKFVEKWLKSADKNFPNYNAIAKKWEDG